MTITKFGLVQFTLLVLLFSITFTLISIGTVKSQTTSSTNGLNNSLTTVVPEAQQSNFLITLFGITNQTGNVFTYIEADNITKGVLYNATSRDLNDGNVDGIVQAYMTILNYTLSNGTEYTACNLVLNNIYNMCVNQHVSPFIKTQFVELMARETSSSSDDQK